MDRESLLPSGVPSCRQSCVPPFCSTGPPCWVPGGGSTWHPERRRFLAALCSGYGETGPELCSHSLDHYALDAQTHSQCQCLHRKLGLDSHKYSADYFEIISRSLWLEVVVIKKNKKTKNKATDYQRTVNAKINDVQVTEGFLPEIAFSPFGEATVIAEAFPMLSTGPRPTWLLKLKTCQPMTLANCWTA